MELIDLLYLGIYYIMLFASTLWILLFLTKRRGVFFNPKSSKNLKITFMIPAFNEEKHIKKCIDSILNLDYPRKNIKTIVVNDGSTDRTKEICEEYERKGLIKLINQKHSGKASALNHALKFVKTNFVATLDADSFVTSSYLSQILGYFKKNEVVVVTPAIKITRDKTLSERLQWLEYLFSIFLRKMFAIFGCQYVIPGPGSVYRTSILKEVGGFDENSIVEDTEIGFRLQNNRYEIENSMDAIVYTEAPNAFSKLYSQRIRWYRGYLQNVSEYSHMILNPKFGNLGMFLIPFNFVWFFILGAIVVDISYRIFSTLLIVIKSCSLVGWDIYYLISNVNIPLDIFYLNVYTIFTIIFTIIAVLIVKISFKCSFKKINVRKKKLNCIVFLFLYPIFISILWLNSIVEEILKRKRRW